MGQKIALVNKLLKTRNLRPVIPQEQNLYNSLDGYYKSVSGKDVWFKVFVKRNVETTLFLEERIAADLYKKWSSNNEACIFTFRKVDKAHQVIQFNMGKRFILWQDNLPKTVSKNKWDYKTQTISGKVNFFEITFDKTMDYQTELK